MSSFIVRVLENGTRSLKKLSFKNSTQLSRRLRFVHVGETFVTDGDTFVVLIMLQEIYVATDKSNERSFITSITFEVLNLTQFISRVPAAV